MTTVAWIQSGRWYRIYEEELPPSDVYVTYPPYPCNCSSTLSNDLHVHVWGESNPRHLAPNREVEDITA